MDNLSLIMFVGLSFFVAFLFFYILKIEKTFETKLEAFELTLEGINQELFKLKKEAKNSSILDRVEKLEKIIDSLVEDIRNIESKNLKVLNNQKVEISSLKSEIKRSKIPEVSLISKNDEDKILNLYKRGYSIEEISKELRIPIGEVEFIVKFSANS